MDWELGQLYQRNIENNTTSLSITNLPKNKDDQSVLAISNTPQDTK